MKGLPIGGPFYFISVLIFLESMAGQYQGKKALKMFNGIRG